MPPTVIFVHGLGLSGEVWAPQIAWCKKNNIPYCAVTLPGHGKRKNEDATGEKAVREIVFQAKKNKQIVLVGHSFGAFLCCLAAKQLSNVASLLLINPLLDTKQVKWFFSPAMKIMKMLQKVIPVYSGNFSTGSAFFWRIGVYPYCLLSNDMNKIASLCFEIRGKKVSLPKEIPSTILVSRYDELLKPLQGTVLPFSGHMLFRIAPEKINHFLGQALLRQQEHHA